MRQLVHVVRRNPLSAGLGGNYTLLPPDDGLLASPKHAEV
jgi:hypothetical protein